MSEQEELKNRVKKALKEFKSSEGFQQGEMMELPGGLKAASVTFDEMLAICDVDKQVIMDLEVGALDLVEVYMDKAMSICAGRCPPSAMVLMMLCGAVTRRVMARVSGISAREKILNVGDKPEDLDVEALRRVCSKILMTTSSLLDLTHEMFNMSDAMVNETANISMRKPG